MSPRVPWMPARCARRVRDGLGNIRHAAPHREDAPVDPATVEKPQRRRRWRRRLAILVLLLLAGVIGLRAAAPAIIEAVIPRLGTRAGVKAAVGDVGLDLLRGRCRLRDLRVERFDDQGNRRLLVRLRDVEVVWLWGPLMGGRARADLRIDGARVVVFPSPRPLT